MIKIRVLLVVVSLGSLSSCGRIDYTLLDQALDADPSLSLDQEESDNSDDTERQPDEPQTGTVSQATGGATAQPPGEAGAYSGGSLVLSGVPVGETNDTVLRVGVSSDSAMTYRYKLGSVARTDCGDSEGYASAEAIEQPLLASTEAEPEGPIRLCVIAGDNQGRYQELHDATEATWIKDTVPPVAPRVDESTRGADSFSLSWDAMSADTEGFIVVRDEPATLPSLSSGITYSVGDSVGSARVVSVGANRSLLEMLEGDREYSYALFAHDLAGNYSTATRISTAAAPLGETDSSFGPSMGLFSHDAAAGRAGSRDIAYALAMDDAGRILVGGESARALNDSDLTIWRLNPDGHLDSSFGEGGLLTLNGIAGNAEDSVQGIVAHDGRIVTVGHSVSGTITFHMAATAWLEDGSPDVSFGIDGRTVIPSMGADFASRIVVDEEQRYLLVGSIYNTAVNAPQVTVIRLRHDGALDPTFGTGGRVDFHPPPDVPDSVDGPVVQIDAAGRIVIGLRADNRAAVARLLDDGTFDSSFGDAGIAWLPSVAPGTHHTPRGLGLAADGTIYAAGDSGDDLVVWSLNADGSANSAFGGAGVVVQRDIDNFASALTLDPAGGLLIGGISVLDDGERHAALWRFLPTGQLDSQFADAGVWAYDNERVAAGGQSYVTDLAVDAQGSAALVGAMTVAGGETDAAVWRVR